MKYLRWDLWRTGTETLICVQSTCVLVTICPFQPSSLKLHTLCTSSNAWLLLSVSLSATLSLPPLLSVFEDTADCRQLCRHSWCLVISLLLFHLCYCFPLLTFQSNLLWQTDHRCPLDSSTLSLAADLLFLVSRQIPTSFLFSLFLFFFSYFWYKLYAEVKEWSFFQCCMSHV